jgi:Fe-S-cluster containining protein
MFECDRCGCCCRNIGKSDIYASLDRGDGVCKYLKGNDCSIYDARPLLCRVDKSYERLFSQVMSREEYYRLNKSACIKLKELEEKK